MAEIDTYAVTLLEQAKRFLEKAHDPGCDADGRQAFLTSSLLLAVASLEAHLNAVADELLIRPQLSVLDQSILAEKDFGLKNGSFGLTNHLKMYRIEDRLKFIFARFTRAPDPTSEPWWSGLAGGLDLRNKIVHAKDALVLSEPQIRRCLLAVVDCVNALYKGVYRKGLPGYGRGLNSQLVF
jgi:hypothetical protein